MRGDMPVGMAETSRGYNWWHLYVMTIFHDVETARQQLRESGEYVRGDVPGTDSGTCYYQLTDREFNRLHPCLTLKEIMIQNKGMKA